MPGGRGREDYEALTTEVLTRAGLNAELDKYTVWPQDVKEKAA